jgi:hypothetical protein
MQVAGILIDLGLPPIEDIPHLPKIVWDACKERWTPVPGRGTTPLFLPFFLRLLKRL